MGDTGRVGVMESVQREVMKGLDHSDIWNGDDFGLFCNMLPDRTISSKQIAEGKKRRREQQF